jgi:Ca2+-binding EF-hand superfamily protein
MKKTIPLIALGMFVFSLMATAQSQSNDRAANRQAKAEERFQMLDKNRDGKLSYAEMQSNPEHRARFDKADVNRDGGLTQDEMRQAYQQKREERKARHGEHREKMQAAREKLKRLDTNQDQALTRAEIGNELPKLAENFDIIDGNNDGKVTREEMKIARKAMRAERAAQAK